MYESHSVMFIYENNVSHADVIKSRKNDYVNESTTLYLQDIDDITYFR